MDSPIHIGDLTTQSIQQKLFETHINNNNKNKTINNNCALLSTIYSSIYSGVKTIQLTVKLDSDKNNNNNNNDLKFDNKSHGEIIVLRRVQDSFVNVTQLFQILIKLELLSTSQVDNYFDNEILSNLKYFGSSSNTPQYLDLRKHQNIYLQGIWIPYDKAVNLALKFDIYEITKKLFLVDVHDFDKLPKANKRLYEEDANSDSDILDSPSKKQKLDKKSKKDLFSNGKAITKKLIASSVSQNSNYPFTLPAVIIDNSNSEIANDIKVKLGDVFKRDDEKPDGISFEDVKLAFADALSRYTPETIIDIPLDLKGQTALHFASTLASLNLVSSFIELGLNSPIRGNNAGESPLISCIQVTNSMEKGNFTKILSNWLYPDIWLLDKRKRTVFHHLTLQIDKNDSFRFYTTKILEYIISDNNQNLLDFRANILNAQDEDGNTALHLAIEKDSKWFIKVLVDLGADTSISNKRGTKPSDFEIIRDLGSIENGDQIFDLISTGLEFLNKRLEIGGEKLPEVESPKVVTTPKLIDQEGSSSSGKIFNSIQQLLSNTNVEYENILNSKREQIKQLDRALHDATIVTANNRFNTKKITEKLINLDNLKLQVANVTDKLALSKQELNEEIDDTKEYDADAPFIIPQIYDKLKKGKDPIQDLKTDDYLLSQLQPAPILKARIQAYKDINSKLEKELKTLVDYSDLTSKFKKVVSICTNVGVNEVDEFLDGLLEAVEGQQ